MFHILCLRDLFMAKKRGLGKSLDALLAYTSTTLDHEEQTEQLTQLSVDQLHRGKYQPRREMDPEALEELAHSIRKQGIIQPLIVRQAGEKYEIIAGERRWHAAKLADLTHVPAIIRNIPDEAAIAIALIENIQRENLNPLEEAIALQRLIEEFTMTHQQVAEAVGKSRASVSNLLRLLVLPPKVKHLLEQGLLEMGHARTLITLPEELQVEAANLIVTKNLSVREIENWVRRLQNPKTPAQTKPQDPDILRLQESLSKQLKMRVSMQCNAKGKGKLIIHYRNLRELDRLLLQIQEA
jgi:ParB family chromosome partitioning protein